MPQYVDGVVFTCMTCGARWTDGHWSWRCEECGGGAMRMPCGMCLGTCGGFFERAALDSNDSGLAHFGGLCRDARPLTDKMAAWSRVSAVLRRAGTSVTTLQRELADWSSDAKWATEPRGPPSLQVALDALAEQGLDVAPRALAHAAFGSL